jgi:hypothetical protein
VAAGVLGAVKAADKPKEQVLRLDDVTPRVEVKQRCETLDVTANGGLNTEEGVRVGDVMVRLGKVEGPGSQKQQILKQEELASGGGKDSRTYVRSYKAAPDDVNWARCGVVATIANGEAVSVVRRRLVDAGFKGLDLIHLGGARVFVRSQDDTKVLAVLDGAKDFFSICFSHWGRWDTEVIPFQRGAWVRIYGIPLQAWNDSFFKLCVMDCGRFLRSDSYTAAKDRLDYARVLIATTSKAVIKKVEHLMVDGSLVEVQIVEEWGYELGDDACLLEDDNVSQAPPEAEEDFRCDHEASNQVDMLIDQIAKGVSDATHIQDDDTQPVLEPVVLGREAPDASIDRVAASEMPPRVKVVSNFSRPGQFGASPRVPACPGKSGTNQAQRQRTTSCPPAGRSGLSGPWSLEWLDAHRNGGAGVLVSPRRREASGGDLGGEQRTKVVRGQSKIKAGGFLRHSLFSLKKIARLPIEDRREVLQILQKNARKRSSRGTASRPRTSGFRDAAADGHSSSSVNNDWKHWVAMQGQDNVVEDDVVEMGNFVGATLKGDKTNMFSVLAKSGTGQRDSKGAVQGVVTLQGQPS